MLYSRQNTSINLESVLDYEFQVVFTVSFFVGNPVSHHIQTILPENRAIERQTLKQYLYLFYIVLLVPIVHMKIII